MVCGGDIALSAVDIPATIFHLSMLICVIAGITKRSDHFQSGFYALFAVISVLDILQILMVEP